MKEYNAKYWIIIGLTMLFLTIYNLSIRWYNDEYISLDYYFDSMNEGKEIENKYKQIYNLYTNDYIYENENY